MPESRRRVLQALLQAPLQRNSPRHQRLFQDVLQTALQKLLQHPVASAALHRSHVVLISGLRPRRPFPPPPVDRAGAVLSMDSRHHDHDDVATSRRHTRTRCSHRQNYVTSPTANPRVGASTRPSPTSAQRS